MKSQLFCLFSITLLLLNGCASVPDLELDKNFEFGKIKTIGIYIDPSYRKVYDGQLYNLLSMHFITLGYNIVDLNPAVSSGTPELSPSFQGFEKTPKTIRENNAVQCDAVIIAKLKLEKIFKIVSETRELMQGFYVDKLQLELVMTDIETLKPVVSRKYIDEQSIFSDLKTKDYLVEPIRFTIQRALSNIFKDFPVSTSETHYTTTQKIPTLIYVDKTYRKYYGEHWNKMIARRILYANDILKKYLNIELVVEQYYEWNTRTNFSTRGGLRDLSNATHDIHDKLVLGIMVNHSLKYDWRSRNEVGVAEFFGNRLVICDQPSMQGLEEWDALEEAITLVHEIGHTLGGIHTTQYNSIMFPETGFFSFKFDSLNASIIKETSNNLFRANNDTTAKLYIAQFLEKYNNTPTTQTFFIESLHGLIRQHHFLVNRKSPLKDGDTVHIDFTAYTNNIPLQYALRGYSHFAHNQWKLAEQNFLQSVELNRSLAEIYYYLTAIYEKLNDKEKKKHYEDLTTHHFFKLYD